MPYDKIIENLGAEARLLEIVDVDQEYNIELPTELSELLNYFQGSIVFTRGAKFKSGTKIPVADRDGYVDVDIFYGLRHDSNNIFLKNNLYKDRIGETLCTFGESGSGDQYCFEKKTGKIYYWHHEAKYEDETKFLIAPNLKYFIKNLIADEEEQLADKTKKVISAKFDF